MNKQLIIGVFAAIVVIGGGAGYALTRQSSNTKKATVSEQTNPTGQTSSDNAFDAVSTNGTSFVATISTTTPAGKTTAAKMEFDKTTGNVAYSSDDSAQGFRMVYTADAYYMCETAGSCIKYPLNGVGDNTFDRESFEYSSDEIANFKNTANYQGEKDCISGKCHVWKIAVSGYESSFYVDTDSKRIVQVDGTSAAGSSKITYDYKDVSVVPPANAQEIPNITR